MSGEPIGFEYAYSEPVIHDDGETVRLEWTRRGYRMATVVADELIEQWVAAENERRRLRSLLREAREVVAEHADRPPRLLARIDRELAAVSVPGEQQAAPSSFGEQQ